MIEKTLIEAISLNVSDVIIAPGSPLAFKIAGVVTPRGDAPMTPAKTEALVREIYQLAGNRSLERFQSTGDDDFSLSIPGVGRFRTAVYRQRGSCAAVIRVVRHELPDPALLSIPAGVINLYSAKKGLVLITGPAGSGKSTTLSCIVDRINRTLPSHVITIEDPIEYLYKNDRSIVSQREVGLDTEDFKSALRYALRQAPNVILVGEMRDYETISIAMTAAETGQLVLSTLHTIGAAKTVDRIIDVFPTGQQQQVRVQLSMTLNAVVSQQLIPTVDGGVTPAFEVMIANPAVRNLIREGKAHQIDNVIYANPETMISMDASITQLYRKGRISYDNAVNFASDPDSMTRRIDRNYAG
ncbi:MAG TPA: PilT/PilU family type 4a pilus ATPase [Clostridia bacterium]|jgi:twitching motility protein PilT|nr:PilT/PilU family type 4a pilus ATPase [Clostridia bacterium]HPK16371.1 PilT/PilU family type 4a pilus ATPase [Clostridia bacterium]